MKKVHKSSGTDDKKLQTALKKLNTQPIQAIEEVNMFKEDGNVIHFAAPKGVYFAFARAYSSSAVFSPITHVSAQLSWNTLVLTTQSTSSCLGALEHLRNIRQWRGQRIDRTRPRYLEPAWA